MTDEGRTPGDRARKPSARHRAVIANLPSESQAQPPPPSAHETTASVLAPAAEPALVRQRALENLARAFLGAAGLALAGTLIALLVGLIHPPTASQVMVLVPPPVQTLIPTFIPIPTRTPFPTATPLPPPVAILAGHSGGIDTGAVCPDGLREVDITKEVAARVKGILDSRGYRTEILAEFDPKLNASKRDYTPRVFLSIHADSCVYYATGFKVARADNSVIPVEEDRLVRCVRNAYAIATQLPFHEGSITTDMTHYHALEEINPQSPGAIIELGFLGSDKALLTMHRDLLAQGVAEGLDNFLRGNACQ